MVGGLLLAIFSGLALAMAAGRLPAILALPVLAIAITLVAGLPHHFAAAPVDAALYTKLETALRTTLHQAFFIVAATGIPRLSAALFTIAMGGIFGTLLKLSGIAEAMVRRVAELAGDSAFEITLALTLVSSLLFTVMGGLGSVILVANMVFPVLASLGVPPMVVAGAFLMGNSLGGVLNVANWTLYTETLKLDRAQVIGFALPFAGIFLVVLVAFLVFELRRARVPVSGRSLAKAAGALALLGLGALLVARQGLSSAALLQPLATPFVALLALACLVPRRVASPGPAAMAAPLVPLGLILFTGMPPEAAFLAGILYLLVTGPGDERSKRAIQAAIEGLQGVAPALAVLMGIGMVLVAAAQDPVRLALQPMVQAVLPSSASGFVLLFALAAPLSLYRGPLNLWGMGSGLVAIIKDSGVIGPGRIMVAFLSTGQIQGVCDPTNTHNVWVANALKLETGAILARTLPWIWVLASLGLLLGVVQVGP